jgi:hypothetical protein
MVRFKASFLDRLGLCGSDISGSTSSTRMLILGVAWLVVTRECQEFPRIFLILTLILPQMVPGIAYGKMCVCLHAFVQNPVVWNLMHIRTSQCGARW